MKINSLIYSLLVLFISVMPFTSNAQLSKKDYKTYKKALKLYEKKKYPEAIEKIKPLTVTYVHVPEIWDSYVDFHLAQYESRVNFGKNLTIRVSNQGNEDSLSTAFAKLLMKALNGDQEYEDYINAMRLATLRCTGLQMTGLRLRALKYDSNIELDTNISEEAQKWFDKAEKEFMANNYLNAAKYYQKALEIDSHFYKAKLYLGDSYYALKDYSKAAIIFRNAIELQPKLIEPRKYYFDALFHMENFEKAKECAIDAILIYPDEGMFVKLGDIAYLDGQKFKRNWMSRTYFPYSINMKIPDATNHWQYYFEAAEKIKPFIKENGTLGSNEITKEIYPEVYCWDYMLANTSDDVKELKIAREMKLMNKLDCYVLYSLYHVDLLDQTLHFAENNREKVRDYIESWLD